MSCKHLKFGALKCRAGHVYAELEKRGALPCYPSGILNKATCADYEEPTEADLIESQDVIANALWRLENGKSFCCYADFVRTITESAIRAECAECHRLMYELPR